MNNRLLHIENEYLNYCNRILDKLSEGEHLHISLNMTGFNLDLYHLVQSYYSSDYSQQKEIKSVLRKSIDIIWHYLIPLDLSDEDNSILPVEFEGDILVTNNVISFHEGELQTALLFVKIALILEDKKLFKSANLIASFSKIKEERVKEETLNFDFKNGTIGVALLYQTIYFLTHEPEYLERANHWYEKSERLKLFSLQKKATSNYQIDQETIAAFEAFKNPKDTIWRKNNFLEFEIFMRKKNESANTYIY
ncbi:hypothetical protein VB796_18835 [Arcicella sp. LKC2W]|uniref:hypothetical protein n=1 Tax=Arcicella sp. LKC2W TaxID=2984198 RepID=UPI002B1F27DA|nr:hypothetical protein [Arcicella sp. LKC2W]MEA5461126.1 hypothetical protein [Arcicella sp. LKC2W]